MTDSVPVLLRQLGRTSRRLGTLFERRIGMPLPRWRILFTLYQQGALKQKGLVEQLEIDPGQLTRQLKTLEGEGLVQRQADASDARSTQVALSEAGLERVRTVLAPRQALFDQLLTGLDEDDCAAALRVLQALNQRLDGL